MTWRELFRRAWLVLRLRRKWFVLCRVCSVPLLAAEITIQSRCEDCEAIERLEQERVAKVAKQLRLQSTPEELFRNAYAELLERQGMDAMLNTQPGAPILLVPGLGSLRAQFGSAIGSAIGWGTDWPGLS